MPCRPAWEVAALPPLAIGGHLDVAELAGAALHLPAAALQLSLPHQATLALVTVWDYGLYRPFGQPMADCVAAVMDFLDSILPFHI